MTIHVISVGRSLLDAFTDAHRRFGADLAVGIRQAHPAGIMGAGDQDAANAALCAWFGGDAPPPETLTRMVDAVRPGLWPRTVSAELNTFARIPEGTDTVAAGDQAVLIATNTAVGLLAAMWNAIAFTGGDPAKVRYLPAPDLPVPQEAGTVVIVRVPQLDASTDDGFRTAMRGLGILGRSLLPGPGQPRRSFRIHLSGGYKAAIPYLIGLAEGLRSLAGQVDSVEAFMLHDTTVGVAIRLPLRRMNAASARGQLRHFTAEGDGPTPVELSLDGYAYDADPDRRGRYRITAFGEGLRALLGPEPPSVGG